MKKQRYYDIIISALALCLAAQTAMAASQPSVSDMIKESDVIVEGFVLNESAASSKLFQENIGSTGVTLVLGFGPVKQTSFYVSKVYKGSLKVNQLIDIFSETPKSKKNNISLSSKKEYLVFLKEQWDKKGYHILEKGKGHWLIFDYDGQKKLKSWNQDPRFRKADAYLDYTDFIGHLQDNLSQIAYGEE